MNKPREWWISNIASGRNISRKVELFTAVKERPQNPPWTHVVEFSAYQAAIARAEQSENYAVIQERLAYACLEKLTIASEREHPAYLSRISEVHALRAKCGKLEAALREIAKGYAEQDSADDCPGCSKDAYFQLNHHAECVYQIARAALAEHEKG